MSQIKIPDELTGDLCRILMESKIGEDLSVDDTKPLALELGTQVVKFMNDQKSNSKITDETMKQILMFAAQIHGGYAKLFPVLAKDAASGLSTEAVISTAAMLIFFLKNHRAPNQQDDVVLDPMQVARCSKALGWTVETRPQDN